MKEIGNVLSNEDINEVLSGKEAENSMRDMVNHPAHYEKGNGHIECIDLLEELCCGYYGIAAMEIGQFKYLYRCGSKGDAQLSVKEKAVEDIGKVIWYMKNFYSKAVKMSRIDDQFEPLPDLFRSHKIPSEIALNVIVKEFTYDKPSWSYQLYNEAIRLAYNLTTFYQVYQLISTLERLQKAYEENFKEE